MNAQAREALDLANETRFRHAALKDEIGEMELRDAEKRVAKIVIDQPAEYASMKVIDLLRSIPFCGIKKASRILGTVPSHTRIGALNERQRVAIARTLVRETWLTSAGVRQRRAA